MEGIEALASLLRHNRTSSDDDEQSPSFSPNSLITTCKSSGKSNSQMNDKVLFITGAGLSKSSGIPTYRSNSSSSTATTTSVTAQENNSMNNATWSRFVYKWGTRQQFLKDPLIWYNTFWLQTHHKKEYLEAQPNKGHINIANICKTFSSVRVVTQNIDGLHLKGDGAIERERIVEVHGHLTYYKCINEDCLAHETTLKNIKLDFDHNNNNTNGTTTTTTTTIDKNKTFVLKSAPKCSECSSPLLPQSLFFDEDYESHPFYQYEKVENWMEECKALVFVGTSNSVGITTNAVLEARRRRIPIFNFNIVTDEKLCLQQYNVMGKERFPIYHILGSCDQTLELLYKVATAKRTSLRRINSTILTNNNNELLFPLKKSKRSSSYDSIYEDEDDDDRTTSPSIRTSSRKKRKSTSWKYK